jgi:hypothetical protein
MLSRFKLGLIFTGLAVISTISFAPICLGEVQNREMAEHPDYSLNYPENRYDLTPDSFSMSERTLPHCEPPKKIHILKPRFIDRVKSSPYIARDGVLCEELKKRAEGLFGKYVDYEVCTDKVTQSPDTLTYKIFVRTIYNVHLQRVEGRLNGLEYPAFGDAKWQDPVFAKKIKDYYKHDEKFYLTLVQAFPIYRNRFCMERMYTWRDYMAPVILNHQMTKEEIDEQMSRFYKKLLNKNAPLNGWFYKEKEK